MDNELDDRRDYYWELECRTEAARQASALVRTSLSAPGRPLEFTTTANEIYNFLKGDK